jgi:hypothetical protein
MQVTEVRRVFSGQYIEEHPNFDPIQISNLPRFAGGLNVARGAERAIALGSATADSAAISGEGSGFIIGSLPATMPSMCCFKTAA